MPGGRPKTKIDSGSVKSVTKVLDILEHLGSSKRAVSVSDIARATGFNVSTAFRLLQTLAARGYVEQQAANRSYILGPRVFQLGSAFLQGNDLAGMVRPHLDALRDTLGETVYMASFKQGENIQIAKADGQHAVSASVRAVEREPAFCTASGKVLLSGLPQQDFAKYVSGVRFQSFTSQTIINKAKLLREVAAVKQRGYALDLEEFAQDLCCVSVPVRHSEDGPITYAISVAMPKVRFKRVPLSWWVSELQKRAALISQQLGFVKV